MRQALFAFLLLALGFSAVAQDQPRRGPSTSEERQRFIALTHKLEQNPLDKDFYADKKWALQWIEDVPDITVTPCPTVFGVEFITARYRYGSNLLYQALFGNVAFLIEHPEKKNDTVAQYTAGVESALKAYKGILRADPVVSRTMEELLEKQTQGKLADFVKQVTKDCQSRGDQAGF